MMKIVFLDSFTTNPGELDWSPLLELASVTLYDRTAKEQVLNRSSDADIIITNKVIFDRDVLEALPKLKYICIAATGYNNIDLIAAKDMGISVSNVVGYSTASVAQHVFALLFVLSNRVESYSGEVRKGRWSNCKDFSYWNSPIKEWNGNTFGIYGFGKIGKNVSKIALALGMKVIAHHKHPERDRTAGVRFVGWEELIERSDVLSLHAPLSEKNEGLFDQKTFEKMKNTAVLINTARGPLLNEKHLVDALRNGEIAGAGLDVLSHEPPLPDNLLLSAPNCIITPHQAWASAASRERLLKGIVANVRAFIAGETINVVNH